MTRNCMNQQKAFIKGLTASVSHFAVVEGNVDKIKKKLQLYPDNSKNKTDLAVLDQDKGKLKKEIENFLIKTIADILNIEGEDLEQ